MFIITFMGHQSMYFASFIPIKYFENKKNNLGTFYRLKKSLSKKKKNIEYDDI